VDGGFEFGGRERHQVVVLEQEVIDGMEERELGLMALCKAHGFVKGDAAGLGKVIADDDVFKKLGGHENPRVRFEGRRWAV
jgi:hypothetical protein